MFRKNRSAAYHWGDINHMDRVTEDGGIIWYDCCSHGGFGLTQPVYESMPQHFKNLSFTKDQFFEEDSSWCAIPLWRPELFLNRPEFVRVALLTYLNTYSHIPEKQIPIETLKETMRFVLKNFHLVVLQPQATFKG